MRLSSIPLLLLFVLAAAVAAPVAAQAAAIPEQARILKGVWKVDPHKTLAGISDKRLRDHWQRKFKEYDTDAHFLMLAFDPEEGICKSATMSYAIGGISVLQDGRTIAVQCNRDKLILTPDSGTELRQKITNDLYFHYRKFEDDPARFYKNWRAKGQGRSAGEMFLFALYDPPAWMDKKNAPAAGNAKSEKLEEFKKAVKELSSPDIMIDPVKRAANAPRLLALADKALAGAGNDNEYKAEAHLAKSRAFFRMGNLPASKEELDKAAALGISSPHYYMDRAQVAREMGNIKEANEFCLRASEAPSPLLTREQCEKYFTHGATRSPGELWRMFEEHPDAADKYRGYFLHAEGTLTRIQERGAPGKGAILEFLSDDGHGVLCRTADFSAGSPAESLRTGQRLIINGQFTDYADGKVLLTTCWLMRVAGEPQPQKTASPAVQGNGLARLNGDWYFDPEASVARDPKHADSINSRSLVKITVDASAKKLAVHRRDHDEPTEVGFTVSSDDGSRVVLEVSEKADRMSFAFVDDSTVTMNIRDSDCVFTRKEPPADILSRFNGVWNCDLAETKKRSPEGDFGGLEAFSLSVDATEKTFRTTIRADGKNSDKEGARLVVKSSGPQSAVIRMSGEDMHLEFLDNDTLVLFPVAKPQQAFVFTRTAAPAGAQTSAKPATPAEVLPRLDGVWNLDVKASEEQSRNASWGKLDAFSLSFDVQKKRFETTDTASGKRLFAGPFSLKAAGESVVLVRNAVETYCSFSDNDTLILSLVDEPQKRLVFTRAK